MPTRWKVLHSWSEKNVSRDLVSVDPEKEFIMNSSTSYGTNRIVKGNSTRVILVVVLVFLAVCIYFVERSKISVRSAPLEQNRNLTEESSADNKTNGEKPQENKVTNMPVAPQPAENMENKNEPTPVKPIQQTLVSGLAMPIESPLQDFDALAAKTSKSVLLPMTKEQIAKPFEKKVEKGSKDSLAFKDKSKKNKKQDAHESVQRDNVGYHIVQPGDSLSSISSQYYGTTKYWQALEKANANEVHAKSLKIGQKILLPALADVEKVSPRTQRPSHTPSRAIFTETAGGKAKVVHPGEVYIVQPGDTVTSIAKKNGLSVAGVFKYNRSLLGKNADELRPGMELLVAPLAAPK